MYMPVLVLHGIPASSVHYASRWTPAPGRALRDRRLGSGRPRGRRRPARAGPRHLHMRTGCDLRGAGARGTGHPRRPRVRYVLPVRDEVVMETVVEAAGLRVPRCMPLPAVLAGGDGAQICPSVAAALAAVRGGTLAIEFDETEIEIERAGHRRGGELRGVVRAGRDPGRLRPGHSAAVGPRCAVRRRSGSCRTAAAAPRSGRSRWTGRSCLRAGSRSSWWLEFGGGTAQQGVPYLGAQGLEPQPTLGLEASAAFAEDGSRGRA